MFHVEHVKSGIPDIHSQAVCSTVLMAYVPMYRVILRDIRTQIERGLLKPGDKIPTTKELADKYDTSVGTARKAVEILLEAEILEGRQGLGVFVAEKP